MDCIARWLDEHARFARILKVVENQLDRFHSGEQPDYDVVFQAMRYMSGYPDRCHHPQEDLAFEKLAKRAPKYADAVAVLIQEHAEIKRSGEELVEVLGEVLDETILTRDKVEKPGRTYIACLRDHMRREEQYFARAGEVLNAADWAAIERAVPLEADPLVAAGRGAEFSELRRAVV